MKARGEDVIPKYRNAFFMQKRAESVSADYAILEIFADRMRFRKNMWDSSAFPSNCKKMSLHAFMTWLHSTFPGKLLKGEVKTIRVGMLFSARRFRIGIAVSERREFHDTHRLRRFW